MGLLDMIVKTLRDESDVETVILTSRVADRAHSTSVETRSTAGLRVLVAEDNPVNRILVLKLLAKKGYKTLPVENGAEAVEQVKKGNVDLLIMDIQMPVMSGLDATKAIRSWEKEEKRRPVPIIGLSANAMAGDAEKALRVGMNDYLTKPIIPHQLYDRIEKWAARMAEDKSDARTEKNV